MEKIVLEHPIQSIFAIAVFVYMIANGVSNGIGWFYSIFAGMGASLFFNIAIKEIRKEFSK